MAIIRDNTTTANTLKIENDGSIDANLRVSGVSVTAGQKTSANSIGVVLASDQSAIPVTVASLPLPSGAALASNQPTLISGRLPVDGSAVTQPISVVSLPLPTGAAIESGNIASVATTNLAMSTATGAITDTAYAGSGSTTLVGGIKGIFTKLASSIAVTGTFWQTTQPVSIASMPSTPVTGTFFQGTQPVSATTLPLPTGAATSANQPTLVSGRLPVDGSAVTQPISVSSLPLPTGAALESGGNLAGIAGSNNAISTNNGTTADAVYAGSGSATINSILKGVYAAIKGILTVTGPVGTPTDRSGSITTGGTAQVLMASSSTRYTLFISNPDATNDLWVALNGITAVANGQGSIRIPANGGGIGFKLPDPARTAISIVGAVTAQKFTAWEA